MADPALTREEILRETERILDTHLRPSKPFDFNLAVTEIGSLEERVAEFCDLQAVLVERVFLQIEHVLRQSQDSSDAGKQTRSDHLNFLTQVALINSGIQIEWDEERAVPNQVLAADGASELLKPHQDLLIELALCPETAAIVHRYAVAALAHLEFDWSVKAIELWDGIQDGIILPSDLILLVQANNLTELSQIGLTRILSFPKDKFDDGDDTSFKNLASALDRLYGLYRNSGGEPDLFLPRNPWTSIYTGLTSASLDQQRRALRYLAVSGVAQEAHGRQNSTRLVQALKDLRNSGKNFDTGLISIAVATVSFYPDAEKLLKDMLADCVDALEFKGTPTEASARAHELTQVAAALEYFYRDRLRIAAANNGELPSL